MASSRPPPDSVRIVHSQNTPPGVSVAHFTTEGQLLRAVTTHFATVLHLAGRSEWSMRRVHWTSSPGTVGVKIPGELYMERARDGRSEFQVVRFDNALVEHARDALDPPRIARSDHAIAPNAPRARAIAAMHRRLLDGDAEPAELEHLLCDALASLVELTSASPEEHLGASAWRTAVARARAMLDERLTETVALDELAAHARLDKYRLCRAFRDEMGLPPHAYVTQRRVSLAQDLLVQGVPQAEVAVRVGLYDQSQLHRHFKRILGVTPGEYARAVR